MAGKQALENEPEHLVGQRNAMMHLETQNEKH